MDIELHFSNVWENPLVIPIVAVALISTVFCWVKYGKLMKADKIYGASFPFSVIGGMLSLPVAGIFIAMLATPGIIHLQAGARESLKSEINEHYGIIINDKEANQLLNPEELEKLSEKNHVFGSTAITDKNQHLISVTLVKVDGVLKLQGAEPITTTW